MAMPRVRRFVMLLAVTAPLSAQTPNVSVRQGGIARWSGLAATECGFQGRRYPAVDAVCYFPVDMKAKVGVHDVLLIDADGKQHSGNVTVTKRECAEVALKIEDESLVKLDEAASKRHREERARALKAVKPEVRDPGFSLPLAQPTAQMPQPGEDFCELRVFNGERRSTHTGRDYAVATGTTLKAPADGIVTLAEDQLLTGNSVYVDHGDGLVSMLFHLDEIAVDTGDVVKRGDTLGKVGATGRVTGPHLHFGARWLNARVDPALLFVPSASLPDLAMPGE